MGAWAKRQPGSAKTQGAMLNERTEMPATLAKLMRAAAAMVGEMDSKNPKLKDVVTAQQDVAVALDKLSAALEAVRDVSTGVERQNLGKKPAMVAATAEVMRLNERMIELLQEEVAELKHMQNAMGPGKAAAPKAK